MDKNKFSEYNRGFIENALIASKPSSIQVSGAFFSSFGKGELEGFARDTVKYLIANGDAWNVSFSKSSIEESFGKIEDYESDDYSGLGGYPLMKDTFAFFVDLGFFYHDVLSSYDSYRVSIDFIARVTKFAVTK